MIRHLCLYLDYMLLPQLLILPFRQGSFDNLFLLFVFFHLPLRFLLLLVSMILQYQGQLDCLLSLSSCHPHLFQALLYVRLLVFIILPLSLVINKTPLLLFQVIVRMPLLPLLLLIISILRLWHPLQLVIARVKLPMLQQHLIPFVIFMLPIQVLVSLVQVRLLIMQELTLHLKLLISFHLLKLRHKLHQMLQHKRRHRITHMSPRSPLELL